MGVSVTSAEQRIALASAPADCLHVVQLTDCHLEHSPDSSLLGIKTDDSLRAVVDLVKKECGTLDCILGTGDIAGEGETEGYIRAKQYFSELSSPFFWLPGNHDDVANMQAVAKNALLLRQVITTPHWQIVMLNSQIPGEVGGRLGEEQLQWLKQQLQLGEEQGLHSLVCLHHCPIELGCEWLDEQQLVDSEAFLSSLAGFAGVKAVLWGHVHQQLDEQRQGIKLLSTPSTCVQFAPGSTTFKADTLAPGYRWLKLYSDGRVETKVSRLPEGMFTVSDVNRGYL